jgi:hypothetical protein
MFRKIEIDDEIYALLQRHARPFEDRENDVLRRLLLAGPATPAPAPSGRPGDLLPYIAAGLIQPGDELVHEQPRKGRVHRATVSERGGIDVDGYIHPKVSPALKAMVGHEINGWSQWTHAKTGKTLHELRVELRRIEKSPGEED